MWHHRPEPRALLASLSANPPAKRTRVDRFGDAWTVYVGQRVAALRCFYQAAEPAIDTPAWREWVAFDEQKAVEQAIQQHKTRKAA